MFYRGKSITFGTVIPDLEVLAGEESLQHPDVLVPHLLHALPGQGVPLTLRNIGGGEEGGGRRRGEGGKGGRGDGGWEKGRVILTF